MFCQAQTPNLTMNYAFLAFSSRFFRHAPAFYRRVLSSSRPSLSEGSVRVLRTPGHSYGSCLYYCKEEDVAFTGDTLFRMSIGRTDFAEGSWTEMECSLKRIVRDLPQTTRLLPGHGPATTMAEEVKHNPYLRM